MSVFPPKKKCPVRLTLCSPRLASEPSVEAGGSTTDPDRARVLIHGAQVLAGLLKDIDVTPQLADLQAWTISSPHTSLSSDDPWAYSSTLEECHVSGGAEHPSYPIDVTQLETR